MTLPAPLGALFDEKGGVPVPLPKSLAHFYGPLRFPRRAEGFYVIANFVSTLDGVVAFEGPRGGGQEISGENPSDRVLMGLLRAVSDAVLVGAGTLRSVPRHLWTPSHVFPGLRDEFAELRSGLGLASLPINVVVTASGDLDLTLPVFTTPGLRALVISTPRGARRLRRKFPRTEVDIAPIGGDKEIPFESIRRVLRGRLPGLRRLLVEGGPHLLADLLSEEALDELFLTLAPQLAGRAPRTARLALLEGKTFGPERPVWSSLVSVRRAQDHLFLRYKF